MFALKLVNISKTFGTYKACDNINLSIIKGEVHAILGENGAGKSTLMNIIFGLLKPDDGGEFYLNEKKILLHHPQHAIKNGIGMVHQHFMLVAPFTVLQNIILGVEPTTIFGMIDYKKAYQQVLNLSNLYHFNIDPDQKVETLTVGMQQRVEILKTLYRNAELLIFDEPTAVLTPTEINDFFKIVENLKNAGKSIIIITHKLSEIKEIADRCTILKKGQLIKTVEVKETSEEELAALMVGRKINLNQIKLKPNTGEVVLKINSLNVLNNKKLKAVNDLSLNLNRGEILGLAGVGGNGQTELALALLGLLKVESGSIQINNQEIKNKPLAFIYQHKLRMIPEDRQRHGLILNFLVKENLVLQNIDRPPFSRFGIIKDLELIKFSKKLIAEFDIRPKDPETKAINLSGGNQQKLILARELANHPEVLIAVCPTRGLDVNAILFIHQELIKLKNCGKAILLISYELDEIINLSDRIAVMVNGKIAHQLSYQEITTHQNIKEHLGFFMAGGSK